MVRSVKDFCSGLSSPLVSLDKGVTILKQVAYDKIGLEMSHDSTANYRKVSKVTTPRKYGTSESSDNMSQVLANPESSDPPENNDPPKVETSKLISLFAKNNGYDRYPEQMKCHTDPRFINDDYLMFLSITLKEQDIHYLFSKSILFTFFAILFFEVPMLSISFSRPK